MIIHEVVSHYPYLHLLRIKHSALQIPKRQRQIMDLNALSLLATYIVVVLPPSSLLLFATAYRLKRLRLFPRFLIAFGLAGSVALLIVVSILKKSPMVVFGLYVLTIGISGIMLYPIITKIQSAYMGLNELKLFSKPDFEITVSSETKIRPLSWLSITFFLILTGLGLVSGRYIGLQFIMQGLFVPASVLAIPAGWFIGAVIGRLVNLVLYSRKSYLSLKSASILSGASGLGFLTGWLVSFGNLQNDGNVINFIILGLIVSLFLIASFIIWQLKIESSRLTK